MFSNRFAGLLAAPRPLRFSTLIFLCRPTDRPTEGTSLFLPLRAIALALRGGLLEVAVERSFHSDRIIIPHHEPCGGHRIPGKSFARFSSPWLGFGYEREFQHGCRTRTSSRRDHCKL